MEDVLGLLNVALSGSKEERTTATRHLEEVLALNPGEYLVYLLQAGCSPQLPADRSLSALLYVKNFMLHTMTSATLRDKPALVTIKSLILSGLATVPTKHRRILLELVRTVVSEFGWNYFPEVLPLIESGSCAADATQSLALLETVYVLAKRFKTMNLEPNAKKLEVSVFLCTQLPKFLGLTDMECAKTIFKLFECAAETFLQQTGTAGAQLPVPEELLQSWFNHLAQFSMQSYAAAAAAGGAVYLAYVKCVKRIGSITFSVVHDAIKKKKASAFAKYFLANFGQPFTQLWVQWLSHCLSNPDRSLHRKSELFAIRYIKMATCNQTLYLQEIKPHTLAIIEKQLFPYLCFGEDDREQFADEGALQEYSQYLLEEHASLGEYSQRQAASNCILAIIADKRAHQDSQGMYGLLSILNTGLSRPDDDTTVDQTFGFLHLLAVLRKSLKEIPDIWQHQMEHVLVTLVAPRLSSPYVHIRCKAIYVCQRYARVPIASEDSFRGFVGAIAAMVGDKDPRVRLSSIDAMCQFLEMKRARPYLKHILVPMVNECIHFNEVVQTTFVPTALSYVSEHFAPELTPVLDRLSASLTRQFLAATFDMKQQEETLGENDDLRAYEHLGVSAMTSLIAINSLVLSTEYNRPALAAMRPEILRVVKFILDQQDSFDFMDKTLEILTHVTYCTSPITPDLWELFPIVAKCVLESGSGVDYFSKLEGVFDNYISNGAEAFFSNEEAINLTLQMCNKMLVGGVIASDEDIMSAPQLIEAALHQAKHQCPALLAPFFRSFVLLLLQALANPEIQQKGVKVSLWLIAATMDAFYFDSVAVLTIMNETNAFEHFFNGYFHFFGAVLNPDLAPKKGKKSKNAQILRQLEAAESLTVLHRKVNILGLSSFLQVATNPSGPFAVHINPEIVRNAVQLLSSFLTQNENVYTARCKTLEENIQLVKAGHEVENEDGEDDDDMDVEMEDDEEGDLTNGADKDVDDAADEDDTVAGGGDDEEGDETDDYKSPIDQVCEVTYYLGWHQTAAGLNPLFVQAASAVAMSDAALAKAQQVSRRYMQLKAEMETALEEDHMKRAQ